MNPLRDIVERLGPTLGGAALAVPGRGTEAILSRLPGRVARGLELKVKRRGDLTPGVARRRERRPSPRGSAGRLKEQAGEFTGASRAFLDRLVDATQRRKLAAERTSLEGLQRETNRLLRSVLVEQQIQVRRPEFESRAYVRPVAGGTPAPTLESLLAFHSHATVAADDSAAEWSPVASSRRIARSWPTPTTCARST